MRRLVATCILLLAPTADGHGACRIERRTEVPVLVWEDHALVELAANDTGAERTVFANTAVGQLGLGRDRWVSSSIYGMGGVIERTANSFYDLLRLAVLPSAAAASILC